MRHFILFAMMALAGAAVAGDNIPISQETLVTSFDGDERFRISVPTGTTPAWASGAAEFSAFATWLRSSVPAGSITGTLGLAHGGTGGTDAATARSSIEITSRVNIQTFTSSGTWTKPAGAVWVEAIMVGGGGGGGSGMRRGTASGCAGGGGGGAGAWVRWQFQPSKLINGRAVTVGTGGAGGASITADDTTGQNGGNGGDTLFGGVKAGGGTGGGGGTISAGTAGAGAISMNLGNSNSAGSGGGAASSGNGAAVANTTNTGPSSGGGGGGMNSGDTVGLGANSSSFFINGIYETNSRNAAGGATAGANGTDGIADSPGLYQGGGGGGGAAGGLAGAAGRGGDASLYGGGGGGGGASKNGFASGRGGNGAAGIVVIFTHLSP